MLWGIAGVLVAIVLVIALFITVVGTPMSLGILFGRWPLTAFVGYLVAAIWIGDWILHRTSPGTVRERPYLAAVIGILIMQILAIIPFFSGIASLFGFGAVLLLAWRTFRQGRPRSERGRSGCFSSAGELTRRIGRQHAAESPSTLAAGSTGNRQQETPSVRTGSRPSSR